MYKQGEKPMVVKAECLGMDMDNIDDNGCMMHGRW